MDRIHVYYANWGSMAHEIYEIDGQIVSQFSGNIVLSLMAITQDDDQNHLMIPFSGTGSGDERYLFLWKINHDFTSFVDQLEKSDLLAMLPGSPEEGEVTLNDVRCAAKIISIFFSALN